MIIIIWRITIHELQYSRSVVVNSKICLLFSQQDLAFLVTRQWQITWSLFSHDLTTQTLIHHQSNWHVATYSSTDTWLSSPCNCLSDTRQQSRPLDIQLSTSPDSTNHNNATINYYYRSFQTSWRYIASVWLNTQLLWYCTERDILISQAGSEDPWEAGLHFRTSAAYLGNLDPRRGSRNTNNSHSCSLNIPLVLPPSMECVGRWHWKNLDQLQIK